MNEEQRPQNERLAIVENAIGNFDKGLSRLENKIDTLLDHIEKRFPTRNEYSETVKRLESRIEDQEREVDKLRGERSKVPAWAATLISILGAIIAALLGSHFHF